MLKQTSVLAIVALGFIVMGSTQGATITFQFGGQITSVDDPDGALGNSVNDGDPFTGSYTFDSATPDSEPDDLAVGRYSSDNWSMSAQLGALTVTAQGSANRIFVHNGEPQDAYALGAFDFDSGTLRISEFDAALIDVSASALHSDMLLDTPPNLDEFSERTLLVDGYKEGVGDFTIYGRLTLLTPEPATIWLIAAGGLTLFRRRR